MKMKDGHPPRKLRRMISTSGSMATAAAPTQLPANAAAVNPIDPFSLADVGRTPGNPIMFIDSSDDSSGVTNISNVINNDILSFSYCYLVGCMMTFM